MADIHIEKTHNFDFMTAREYAKKWLGQAQSEFGLQADYQESEQQDVVVIKRSGVDGRAVLTADKIVFEAQLGFLAKPFKSSIASAIQSGLDKYFS